jgi:hypothetical protein
VALLGLPELASKELALEPRPSVLVSPLEPMRLELEPMRLELIPRKLIRPRRR